MFVSEARPSFHLLCFINFFVVMEKATLIHYTCTNGRVDRCTGKVAQSCRKLFGDLAPNDCPNFAMNSTALLYEAAGSFDAGDPWDCATEHVESGAVSGCNGTCVAGADCVGYDRIADICISADDFVLQTASKPPVMIDVCSYPSCK